MNKTLAATLLVATSMMAQSSLAVTPLWLRDVQISPDGSKIAFTYKGDIYTVGTKGGDAVRLTSLPSYESQPVWSADGTMIAFASDRNGGQDVYVMSAAGGDARRLTFNSANELPQGFTPDGSCVLFSASIQDPATSAMFPTGTMSELYSVPVNGGRVQQVLGTPALAISYLPDGESFLYEDVKGGEDQWRKHHTSSVTRDVWRYDAKSGKHTNLTNRGGEYRNPVLAPDGQTVYMLSEHDGGSFNVYSFPLDNPAAIKKETTFDTHPVRFLSMAGDNTMAFTYGGEIYTMKPGGTPSKVPVSVMIDTDDPNAVASVNSATEAAVSPDGKQVAYVSRGEIFVTSVDHSSVKQVTHTPEAESDVTWGKNSRELYYTSLRDGHYNIYRAEISRADDPNFSNATLVNETPVFDVNDKTDRTYPSLSPDGKRLAYVADRTRLMVRDLATGVDRQLTDGSTIANRTKGFPAEWSPNGEWLLLQVEDLKHQPYSDIAVLNVESGEMTYVNKTGYFDENPHWVMDGNAILFKSDRYGMRNHASWGSEYDVMITFLNQDAYDRFRLNEEDYALLKEVEKSRAKNDDAKEEKGKGKGSKDKDAKKDEPAASESKMKPIELEGLADRTVRLTPYSSHLVDAMLSADGEKLYYLASYEKDTDLWERSLRKGDTRRVTKLGGGADYMVADNDGNIYIMGSKVRKYKPGDSSTTDVSLGTTLRYNPALERQFMLDFVRNEERERFYTPTMHGVDWDAMYEHYNAFLPHIDNNYDFAELLSELLGELNVSHTGGRYYPAGANEPTSSLGLLYSWSFDGDGLLVDEVVEKGPFDHAASQMRPGMVITAINGNAITADSDYTPIFNNLARKKTLVQFRNPSTGATYEEVVLPITSGQMTDLLYNRWVKQREADVDRLSNGRLGYVHIRAMNDDSFRPLYSKVLGEFVDREGIVIDTRFNGGGRMHEDIEVMFSAKPYLMQDVHGVPTTVMPSRRWTKPSIMVMGEANYSNAHGTPWVYKHMGLGKLVGMPVPGTMTSVNWVRMQDPTLVFGIPVTGYRTVEGTYLENSQLEPDIKVANNPAVVITGEDQQLEAAVRELLKELESVTPVFE